MKKVLFFFSLILSLTACHEGEDPDYYKKKEKGQEQIDRTVLIYISGENDLSTFIRPELEELCQGSKDIGNNALVVYVDDANSSHLPCIMRIKDGVFVDSTLFEKDENSSAPNVMSRVLNYTSEHYPAQEYGLVLWGHSSGWIFEDSIATKSAALQLPRKGYGVDNGQNAYQSNGKWMNIYTLAKTLNAWQHLKFIFADCCQFQCIESAYELRNTTDYIIASPAEVPGKGAPYQTITKGFFERSDSFYRIIVDNYFAQSFYISYQNANYYSRTPLSVVKTAELDQLAVATNAALHSFLPTANNTCPDLLNEKLIYYRGKISNTSENIEYDMNDLMRRFVSPEAYAIWKEAFDRVVVYKVNAKEGWMTNNQILPYVFGRGNDGTEKEQILTDERYGGMSMFLPQDRPGSSYAPHQAGTVSYEGHNASIKHTSWYGAARLAEFGW